MTDKKEVGAPTKYKEQYNEQAAKLCKLGATDKVLADFFDVCETTIDTWKREYPKFLGSIKSAKTFSDELVEKSLYQRALGYEVTEERTEESESGYKTVKQTKHVAADNTSMIFWLKNRKPADWRDKREVLVEVEDSNIDDLIKARERLAELGIDADAV